MKVRATKPKGSRMFKSRTGITVYGLRVKRELWIEMVERDWWFDLDTGQWTKDFPTRHCSSYYAMRRHGFKRVYSLKSALKLIRKWDVPKGTEFRVSLPFMGHDFYVTK